ncbi:MAG: radical SAM protein [Nitrospirae bacterium]|nr:radical SAM protein [Nitrospirota bacterium]
MLFLYVHIPFCLKKCIYCDFVSGIYDPAKANAYIEALKKEIHAISNAIYPSPIPLPDTSTLYIGGGTPTALSTERLTDLITHIFNTLPFQKNTEATIEANPGTVDRAKLSAILSSGINRLSIGVQSFDDNELACLGRLHTAEDAERAVLLAGEAGFRNTGIDLIYAIPGQGMASLRKTLEKAVSLKPQHISAYELTVEKGTLLYEYMNLPAAEKAGYPKVSPPFTGGDVGEGENSILITPTLALPRPEAGLREGSLRQGGGEYKDSPQSRRLSGWGFVDEEEIIKMYNYTIDYLTSAGYIHYEISNFSLPGYQCRHNLNYWQRGKYYGAGIGASSFINGKRLRNTAQIDDYIKLVSENKSPVKESEAITKKQALSEAIFLGLRQTEGINVDFLSQRYGENLLTYYRKEIAELEDAGLLEFKDNHMRLTRKGFLLSNEAFKRFL